MKVESRLTAKRISGNQAEERAQAYLTNKGLVLVEKNFSCKLGEIDLIMLDQSTLVFVEVRYRKNANFGSALETVNYSKQKKIIAAAQFYLRVHSNLANSALRFDVVGITGDDIQWISSAFSV